MSARLCGLFFCVTLASALMQGCIAKSQSASETKAPVSETDFLPGVKIVYSSNINGELEPCGCRTNPTGGVQRRWNWLKKEISGETLSIDSGDLFYSSNIVPALLKPQWDVQAEAIAESYKAMKIEYFVPGELDFASGFEQFEKLADKAGFKVLAANLYLKGKDKLWKDPYAIVEKGGVKVGIIGLYGRDMGVPPELEVKDPLVEATAIIKKLRPQVKVLIALTHLGLEYDDALAKKFPEIDAVFGAHTQNYLIQPIQAGKALIFHPSLRGQHIGVYEQGQNTFYQMDTRYDSPQGEKNPLDILVEKTKERIAEANKKMEKDLGMEAGGMALTDEQKKKVGFQTFTQCASCHVAQFDFHQKKPHSAAYMTLVNKKQQSNLDCLKCHTLGLNHPQGYPHVDKLVFDMAGKAISAEKFAKELPKMKASQMSKYSKAFINIQCETCHGAGGEHPFGSGLIKKEVNSSICLQCHTADQAPAWYKDGKPDEKVIAEKIKSMSCPADKKL